MSTRETLSNDPKATDPGASALYTAITPGYFDSIGVKLLRGRDFTQAECESRDSRRLAIIDEEMSRKLFPKHDELRFRYLGILEKTARVTCHGRVGEF